MATVTMNGKTCQVRTQRDLDKNWAVCVLSGGADDVSLWAREASSLVVKLHARSAWYAEEGALKSLKERGAITDYVLDPKPEEPSGAETEEPEE